MTDDLPASPFLRRVCEAIRVRHYSIRTERSYVDWIRRYILFHGKSHPQDLGAEQVAEYLTYLAVERNVAASTQNQALNALNFLYKIVLDQPLGDINGVTHAKRPKRLPVVLTSHEVGELLAHLKGVHWLIGCLQYGSGLRLLESVRIRVKDLDFTHRAILVRNGKGGKDLLERGGSAVLSPLGHVLRQSPAAVPEASD